MAAQAPVEQPTAYADYNANSVSHPVAHVGAAVKRGLYELNEAAEGARANEHCNQPQAARTGQREGECGEGDEVHELVAALGRGRGRLEGPEHGHTQGDRQKDCEGDVEVLAHGAGVAGALGKGKRLKVAMPRPALKRVLNILT
jgi:hypothetical protein